MVWIYAVEGTPTFGPPAEALFRKLRAARHTIVASHLVLAEVLVLPVRSNNAASISMYRQVLLDSNTVELAMLDAAAALHFASIRATYRHKTPDALHLAIAAASGVDLFVTADHRLLRTSSPGIGNVTHFQNSGV